MVEVECLSASDFSQAWKRFGDGGERVPLWCENSALCDVMRGGVRGGGVRGDDTRSIAHQVSSCCHMSCRTGD